MIFFMQRNAIYARVDKSLRNVRDMTEVCALQIFGMEGRCGLNISQSYMGSIVNRASNHSLQNTYRHHQENQSKACQKNQQLNYGSISSTKNQRTCQNLYRMILLYDWKATLMYAPHKMKNFTRILCHFILLTEFFWIKLPPHTVSLYRNQRNSLWSLLRCSIIINSRRLIIILVKF